MWVSPEDYSFSKKKKEKREDYSFRPWFAIPAGYFLTIK
jgi:hypothetical protein